MQTSSVCVCKAVQTSFFPLKHAVLAVVNVPSGVLHVTLGVKIPYLKGQAMNFVPCF